MKIVQATWKILRWDFTSTYSTDLITNYFHTLLYEFKRAWWPPYQVNPNRRNQQALDFDLNKYKEVNCVVADTKQSILQMSYLPVFLKNPNVRRDISNLHLSV